MTIVHGRNIAIIGGSGRLGKLTVDALLRLGGHTIIAIQREDSTSSFPEGVNVEKGDLADEAFLAAVFKDQEVVILMPPLAHLVTLQEPAVRAAAKAGVPYILPSEFGPDPFAGKLVEENMLLRSKREVRRLIESCGVSSWVSIVVGPWLDLGLSTWRWGVDVKARKATIWSGANARINTASVLRTAQAVAAVVSLPEADLLKHKNGAVYAPSVQLTQREILEAVQHATASTDSEWDLTFSDAKVAARDCEEKIRQGQAAAHSVKFSITHFLEDYGGDFSHKIDHSELQKLRQLGLQEERLEDIIKSVL